MNINSSKIYLTTLLTILCMVFGSSTARSAGSSQPKFHCENDTAELRKILLSIPSEESTGNRIAAAARQLLGRGADNYLFSDSNATLRINIDTFYPISFINSTLALGKIAGHEGAGWRSFNEALTDLSCRQGNDVGFKSILWHVSDWAGDNIYRGNLKELTDNYQGARDMTVSLDYMTRHRDEFASLADREVYEDVRMMEMGFRNHKIPYLPRQAMGSKDVEADLRAGDIIVLVNDKDGSDLYTIGIVNMRDDGPHLIHFDPRIGMVVEEEEPLKRYVNKVAKYIKGFRWFRLT